MSIHEALKRAQQERDRTRGKRPETPAPVPSAAPDGGPVAAALAQQNTATEDAPAAASAPEKPRPAPASTPLAAAIQAGDVSPAKARAAQAAATIVEDYESKRRLRLPPAMVVYHDRSGPVAEQYRNIRNALLADGKTGPRLWVVTSAVAGEGKTTTVLNLGLSMVEMRALRVLLIDADLRTGGLSHLLQVADKRGLSDIIPQEGNAEEAIQATPWHNLYVLPSGGLGGAAFATQTLQSPHVRSVLRVLRNRFDAVLVDSPGALDAPDAGLLAAGSDGVLMAVGLRLAKRTHVQQTMRMLASLNVPVRGTILTRCRHH